MVCKIFSSFDVKVIYIFFSVLKVSANGNVLRSEIVGAIKMRVYLSGMPELRLGLNDKVLFESTGSESMHKY
jgi:AP-1 complex subunit mu